MTSTGSVNMRGPAAVLLWAPRMTSAIGPTPIGQDAKPTGEDDRIPLHWTEFVGGDLAMTLTYGWQERFNTSGFVLEPRIELPVDRAIMAELERIPDFAPAYEPDGLEPQAFDDYGATRRTIRSFAEAYHDLLSDVRDVLVPDPDRAS